MSQNVIRNSTSPQNQQQQQPNVRHIPIFVEGRDEPIINKTSTDCTDGGIGNIGGIKTSKSNETPLGGATSSTGGIRQGQGNNSTTTTTSNQQQQQNQTKQNSSDSIFNRVKNFPVRFEEELSKTAANLRGKSPGRTIPIQVQTTTTTTTLPSQQQQYQQQQHQRNGLNSPIPTQQQSQSQSSSSDDIKEEDPIEKIQKIQKDVLEIITKLETIVIKSRKDKEYLYLDEMLTQNLLKLDTINADGCEHIKQARRAAIKCVNKCIEVLECKAENGLKSSNSNLSDYDNLQQQN